MFRATVRTALTLLLAGFVVPAMAQNYPGRPGMRIPERTEAGQFDGTWYYVMRDAQVCVWLRDAKDGFEIKLRYLDTSTAESFETDWQGQASYRFANKPAKFSFELVDRTEQKLHGRWNWELGEGELRRTETAWVSIYRTGDGRALVMNFEDMERFHGGVVGSYMAYVQLWTLRKASHNIRRWEELPF